MKAVVPFKTANAKSRLSAVLTAGERAALACRMLDDVTGALRAAGLDVVLLATAPLAYDAEVVVSGEDLNTALNRLLRSANGPVMIAMADIPLITEKNIRDMLACREDLVIAPGRGGGTNVQLVREPGKYRVDYYGASFLDHLRIAEERGLSVSVFDSFNASSDIDEGEDLVELYIHGKGRSAEYLRSLMDLDASHGRVRLARKGQDAEAGAAGGAR